MQFRSKQDLQTVRRYIVKVEKKGYVAQRIVKEHRFWAWTEMRTEAFYFEGPAAAKKALRELHPDRLHGVEIKPVESAR